MIIFPFGTDSLTLTRFTPILGDVASFPSLFFSIDTAQNNIFPFLKIARHLILLHQDIWQRPQPNALFL